MFGQEIPRFIAPRVHYLVRQKGSSPFALVPVDTEDLSAGFKTVTWKQFGAAVDKAVDWLRKCQSEQSPPFDTFAYAGPCDIRWLVFFVAGAKARIKILLTYSWTAVASLVHLYEGTGCTTLFHAQSSETVALVAEMRSCIDLTTLIEVPELDDWTSSKLGLSAESDVEPSPLDSDDNSDADRVVAYFQSSGTTGLPKPIPYTNAMLWAWGNRGEIARADPSLASLSYPGWQTHSTFYISHISGIAFNLIPALYDHSVPVIGHGRLYASVTQVKQILRLLKIDAITYPPSVLSALANDDEALRLLSKVKLITTGGASLDATSARRLLDLGGPKLHALYGSTEMQALLLRSTEPALWPYLSFDERNGVKFVPHITGDLFELVIRKQPVTGQFCQPVFSLFPDLDEFRSNDLFSPHSTEEGLWRYRGRTDDIMVLDNAQNVYVADMERHIEQDRCVSSVVIVSGRCRLVAIIELEEHARNDASSAASRSKMVDKLWPVVEEGNGLLRSKTHAFVTKARVIIADPKKPFPRLGKRNVSRGDIQGLYEAEIEQVVRTA